MAKTRLLSEIRWIAILMAVCGSLFFISSAFAAELKTPGTGFDIRNQINGSQSCNAGADKNNGCACEKGFADKLSAEASKAEGKPSGGQCLYGVRTAFQRACNAGKEGAGWCLSAKDAGKCLRDLKFKEHIGEMVPTPPPKGTVFVYKGGGTPHGHIEVFTGKDYCSDFCKPEMITKRSLSHSLVGWYTPPDEGCGI